MFLSKEEKLKIIRFNDTKLRIIGIPFLGIMMPIAFFDLNPFENLVHTIVNLIFGSIISFFLWQINRLFTIYFKHWFTRHEQLVRRIFYQFLTITIFTLAFTYALFVFSNAITPEDFKEAEPNLIRAMFANLFIVYIISGMYETVYFVSLWNDSRLESEQLKTENYHSQLEALKSRVNPHFLFNSLNTLSSVIPEDSSLAVKFVQELSHVYRYILELKDKEIVQLKEELECVNSYVFLLKIRFGNNLNVDFDLPKKHESKYIIPLALQMLIENAVKHNVVSKAKPLTIKVSIDKEGFLLVSNKLQVKSSLDNSTKTGHNNINNRYKLLSNKNISIIHSNEFYTVALPLLEVAEGEII